MFARTFYSVLCVKIEQHLLVQKYFLIVELFDLICGEKSRGFHCSGNAKLSSATTTITQVQRTSNEHAFDAVAACLA